MAYKDLRINDTLSNEFANAMAAMGTKLIARSDKPFTASTDMGNASYAVPSFQWCERVRRYIKSPLLKKQPHPKHST
jgi:hypothetical protein